MYSAVITDNKSIHSARFPYVFIRDDKSGESSRFHLAGGNTLLRAEGRHYSHADGCWLSRFSVTKLDNGLYTASSRLANERDLTVTVTVKDGSVEGLK